MTISMPNEHVRGQSIAQPTKRFSEDDGDKKFRKPSSYFPTHPTFYNSSESFEKKGEILKKSRCEEGLYKEITDSDYFKRRCVLIVRPTVTHSTQTYSRCYPRTGILMTYSSHRFNHRWTIVSCSTLSNVNLAEATPSNELKEFIRERPAEDKGNARRKDRNSESSRCMSPERGSSG